MSSPDMELSQLLGNLGFLLPLLLELPDGVVVVPSDGEFAKETLLVPRLQPQNLRIMIVLQIPFCLSQFFVL